VDSDICWFHGLPGGRITRTLGGVELPDRVLVDNARHVAAGAAPVQRQPARRIAVVTCMDVRIDVDGTLGLRRGDAHVLRNAGGIVTDDTIRSLALSQWLLGTRSVLVLQHTDCALHGLHGPTFQQRLYQSAGQLPNWDVGTFVDLETSVRESVRRLASTPFLRYRDQVHGFVLDVPTGRVCVVR
jgi:carbonic anhydrase